MHLAGISTEYYTRIEQGRVARASDAVIIGLAEALRLTDTERGYLFELLGSSTGGRIPQRQRQRSRSVRPPLRQLLGRLENSPAFVLGVGMEVLAMNELATLFLHDFTTEKGTARSLARWAFLAPEARSFYLDRDDVAADMTAILRRDASSHRNDRELNELIGELTVKSSDFRQWWAQHKGLRVQRREEASQPPARGPGGHRLPDVHRAGGAGPAPVRLQRPDRVAVRRCPAHPRRPRRGRASPGRTRPVFLAQAPWPLIAAGGRRAEEDARPGDERALGGGEHRVEHE